MKPAIEVDRISKQFRLGGASNGYKTLRESVTDGFRRSWKALRGRNNTARSSSAPFLALKDVSFEVQPGEVVGIIGRNGSGKSTLLKILSQIYEPTSGQARVRGRLASLLEVGTGFHPELTGRENIYLNGSILGMSRREISRQFDNIVAFSEIERFLDTPVKRYSSGMYVRLAFAVAAHLSPEILIVDEVLAVGDATYQQRCIKRMEELTHNGQTILFVSHNLEIIPRLCRTVVLLDRGKVRELGPSAHVVKSYLEELSTSTLTGDLHEAYRTGDGRARFKHVSLHAEGKPTSIHRSGNDLTLCVQLEAVTELNDVAIAINLCPLSGARIHSAWTKEQNLKVHLAKGMHTLSCTFSRVLLRPCMTIDVELWMNCGGVLDHVPQAMKFTVVDSDDTMSFSSRADQGIVLTPVKWQSQSTNLQISE